MSERVELIKFLNWVSKDWTPDNGIGHWVPSNNIDADSITTEELIEVYEELIDNK